VEEKKMKEREEKQIMDKAVDIVIVILLLFIAFLGIAAAQLVFG